VRDGEEMNPKTCVVIGAGLSGLSAAHLLTKNNWEVTVLEAEKWVGGRVYSFRFDRAKKLVCELGGEWIGKDHDAMIDLCEELNLKRIPHRFDFFFFEQGRRSKQYVAGAWPFSWKAKRAYERLKKQNCHWSPDQQSVLDRKDWWTILRDRGFTQSELLRRDLMDSTDFGESIRQTGGFSAAAEYFDSDVYDEMDTKIVGGNHKLADALERKIKTHNGKILTSHRVWAIEQPDSFDGVIVRTTGRRRTLRAKCCICTVPARTLTNIRFRPALPDDQWDAAKQLQYARIMKTAILCETRFWMKDRKTKFSCFTDATSDFLFDATLGQGKPTDKGILCSYAIGDKADDLAAYSEAHLRAKLQEDLQMIFPGTNIRIIDIHTQPWQFNKFTQGAYGFYRPGQWFTVREILSRPFKRVHFAGEHIAEEQGFMEGAVDTGQAAARIIM
jgi:monoamine oxidase